MKFADSHLLTEFLETRLNTLEVTIMEPWQVTILPEHHDHQITPKHGMGAEQSDIPTCAKFVPNQLGGFGSGSGHS